MTIGWFWRFEMWTSNAAEAPARVNSNWIRRLEFAFRSCEFHFVRLKVSWSRKRESFTFLVFLWHYFSLFENFHWRMLAGHSVFHFASEAVSSPTFFSSCRSVILCGKQCVADEAACHYLRRIFKFRQACWFNSLSEDPLDSLGG